MPSCRFYPGVLLIFILSIGMATFHRPMEKGPGVKVDWMIKDSFPCIDELLRELITDKAGMFHDSDFYDCFAASTARVFITYRSRGVDTGAVTHHGGFKADRHYYDTIYLNRALFPRSSREYLAAIVIHEFIHIYITFCYTCYGNGNVHGIDSIYLKKHFPLDWKLLQR